MTCKHSLTALKDRMSAVIPVLDAYQCGAQKKIQILLIKLSYWPHSFQVGCTDNFNYKTSFVWCHILKLYLHTHPDTQLYIFYDFSFGLWTHSCTDIGHYMLDKMKNRSDLCSQFAFHRSNYNELIPQEVF